MQREDAERIGREICAYVAAGGLVIDALEHHSLHPQQWWDMTESNRSLGEMFARARVSQCHSFAEEMIRITDAARGEAPEVIQWVRVASENRRWFVSKLAARIYGERIDVTSAGERIGVIAMPAEDSESPASLTQGQEIGGEAGGNAAPRQLQAPTNGGDAASATNAGA